MSEELIQRSSDNPKKIGENWLYWSLGQTTINQLKKESAIRSINYGENIERKKPDGIITEYKKVIAVIEWKTPENFNTQKKKDVAISQAIEVAKRLRTRLVIATDGQETLWVNVKTGNYVKNSDESRLKYSFNVKDLKLQEKIKEVLDSISEKNDKILPVKLINPTNLAKQVWQEIWVASGKSPEVCLYTFAELFIFKYLSDLGILTGNHSFDNLSNLYKTDSPIDVLDHYARVIRPKVKKLFPPSSDGTSIINGIIFVNENQGEITLHYETTFKDIIKKFEKYGKLENIDYDFKSKLFESFLKESNSIKTKGQYFTPIKVVRAINEMASSELKENMKICDPACGVGKFPLEFIKDKIDKLFPIEKGKIIPKVEIIGFDRGFDKDEEKTIILAKANMLIYFSDLIKRHKGITEEFAKLFNKSFVLKTSRFGTLSDLIQEEYDLILTNPPYVRSGTRGLKKEIEKVEELKDYYKTNASGLEGLFMEWIIKALKSNGKAFIVIPDGILNRQGEEKLRQFILDTCYLDAIISLPENTFFDNSKKTYILVITKKNDTSEKQTDKVFTYLVSEIGESRDNNRFEIDQDDLTEAVELFNSFKGNKRHFHKFQETKPDKRCKLWEIESFDPAKSWTVDRWWKKEDLIELGIIEREKIISLDSFSEIVKEVSDIFKIFSNWIKEVSQRKRKIDSFEEISLGDEKYFDLFIGKRTLKKEIINLNGTIPIYSANVEVPWGYHEENIISDFNNNFVLWGIDGDFKFNFVPKNQPFYPTDHCGVIRILNDDILPEYLMFQLEENKHKFGFDRSLRASLENMRQVSVYIPFEKEKIDVKKQEEIAEKYQLFRKLRNVIKLGKQEISNLVVEIEPTKSNDSRERERERESATLKIVKQFPSAKSLIYQCPKQTEANSISHS